jgi:large subunit ribosomal protein L21
MYAVIKTGGKQYKVAEQQVVKIEKTDGEVGTTIKFEEVLAIADQNGVRIGNPTITGATISAEILEQKKDDKVIIFKKNRRQNYRRKNGHRQQVTVVRILDVSGKGEIKKVTKIKEVEPSSAASEKVAVEVGVKAPKKAKPAAKKTEGTKKKTTKKD